MDDTLDTINMYGDVMYSAYGTRCIQFEGKLIENPEARTTITQQLTKYNLALDSGTCASADFPRVQRWSKTISGVTITIWVNTPIVTVEMAPEQLTFLH